MIPVVLEGHEALAQIGCRMVLSEPIIVPGAGHVDLYDRQKYIPFDKLTDFFTANLK